MSLDLQDFAAQQQGQIGAHGMIEVFRKTRIAVGWDPASTTGPDDSAVVVTESVQEPAEVKEGTDWFDPKTMTRRLLPQIMYVRKALIMPRGTSYPDQWKVIRAVYDDVKRHGKTPELWVDATGLGGPLPSMGKQVGLGCERIKITSGDNVTRAHGDWHIPKSVLAGLAVAHLHNRELKFPSGDTTVDELVKQLQTFVSNTSAAGTATYAAQAGAKDDLACALFYTIFALSNRAGRRGYSVVSF